MSASANTHTATQTKKLILVIGATGAQGSAVVNALLAPSADGSPSPYAVRAFTRDPESRRATALAARGVELFKGSFEDFGAVAAAFKGVYGAFVNTDGFTVGDMKEIYCGIKIFEIAKMTEGVKHYVWSGAGSTLRMGNYNPRYYCGHSDGKAKVSDWLSVQPSEIGDGMTWSQLGTAPYMEMLQIGMFGPANQRADGTFVFATPVGTGHVPMVALKDLGFFARYLFDHREEFSGQSAHAVSDIVGWDYLVETFRKVTGHKAVVLHQTLDEWFKNFKNTDRPLANERGAKADGSTSWKENFTGWWARWQDDLFSYDVDWVRSVHPDGFTLEKWMRENDYKGLKPRGEVLKNGEDSKGLKLDLERVSQL